jgi:hypothetical protein
LQAVSLVERTRPCIVHPSAQYAAAARESVSVLSSRYADPATMPRHAVRQP